MSVVLKAEKRELLGTSAARKMKREGNIPAVIYSKDGNINLSLNAKEFEHEYFKGAILTSVIELDLNGKKTKVIAHKVELDPVSDHPVHVDFLDCEKEKTIRAQPKIVFTNLDKSPGIKKGGFLHTVLRKTTVICENGAEIPEKLEIDASTLHLGYKIRAERLSLPKGVKLAKKDNFLIASLIGRGKSEEDPAAAAQAAAGSAAPAAKAEDKKPAAKK